MKLKKLLAGILSAAMVLCTVSLPVFADGENVITIGTAQELVELSNSSKTNNFAGKTVILTNDINMAEIKNFTPIGATKMFVGTFDGDGHTISNLTIQRSAAYGNGLFGNLNGPAVVKNLTLDNARVSAWGYCDFYTNVVGAVAAYAYGNVTFDNIIVKNSHIDGFGKVAAVLGMAADPGGVTTIKDCTVESTKVCGVYDVATFIGLSQNKVDFKDNSMADVTWGKNTWYSYSYVSLNDTTVKNNETLKVKGLFYKVGNELYNAWADYYTDFTFGYERFELENKRGFYVVDGLLHNEYEAKIGDVKYSDSADAFAAANAGDIVECKDFAPNNADLSNIKDGLVAIVDGNNSTIRDYKSDLNNDNITHDEKIDVINSLDISKIDEETKNDILSVVKEMPSENKEQVNALQLSKIVSNSADKIVEKDNDEAPVITATSVATGVNTLAVTKLEFSEALQQPESVNAIYFDVTLKDASGNKIKEGDVPVLVEINVEDASNVEKLIRSHEGVISEIPFVIIDDTHVVASITKFSEFAAILNQNVPAGSAVLGFEPISSQEPNTARFNLCLTADEYKTIKQFESGEFSFSMTGASAAEFTPASGLELVYSDNMGKYRVNRTADKALTAPIIWSSKGKSGINLGVLTLTGAGSGSLSVDDIKMFQKGADSLAIEINTLPSATTNYSIEPTFADLTVNADFPNNIVNNETAYQNMSINIKGADFDETYKLGSNASSAISFENNKYTLKLQGKLMQNTAYTVTVSGAGYRTARYTVTMTNDKVLNFWNNAKDADAVVEEGNANSARKVTFLAGDIVKDNSINIYDLSAVVSYFGTKVEKDTQPEYAKYDLNRDGVIDSKDVAYVLVSWGK